jgi:hypothetical protein
VEPASPSDAIDRGRDSDPNRFVGADQPADTRDTSAIAAELRLVAQELRTLYIPRFQTCLDRLLPEYLDARNQAQLAAEDAKVSLDPLKPPQPAPSSILPAHPLDRGVIDALCRGAVEVDLVRYRNDHPEQRSRYGAWFARSRLHFALRSPRAQCRTRTMGRPTPALLAVPTSSAGSTNWLRVDGPVDATARGRRSRLWRPRVRNLIVAQPPCRLPLPVPGRPARQRWAQARTRWKQTRAASGAGAVSDER